MDAQRLSLAERWVFALKPASWPKLLVGFGLGQAIGIHATGAFSLAGLLAGVAFTGFHLAYVVLINDWGDQEIDGLKRRLFPELGAAKTIHDRVLEPRSVGWAGAGAAAAAAGIAIAAQEFLGRPGLGIAGLGCLGLLWVYTLPPLRLNYRGGGEFVEMLGVGFALPWWNAYVQGGIATPPGMAVLPAFALLALASALASGLSDEPSDRLGGKRTFVVLYGRFAVHQAVEGLVLAAMLVWAALPWLAPHFASTTLVLPAVAVMAFSYRELRARSQAAFAGTYGVVRDYKASLHRLIARGSLALAVSLVVAAWLGPP